jgi:FkbM family methyltransferase
MMRLEERTMIDVGAERGSLAEGMLRAGTDQLHAIDPHPDNARALHARFDADSRVQVHECAVSDGDGDGELHVSSSPAGAELPFGHTLLERTNTDEILWDDAVTVSRRSLRSLIDTGEIPRRAGILKIDTEGHDLAVVRGMGALDVDIVMVEHWTDLPHGLGVCPWTTTEMVTALQMRGFARYAFIVHRGDFVNLQWDDGDVERGAMGNLVFFHDRVLTRLLPDLLEFAVWMTDEVVRVGQKYVRVANERLVVLDELKQAADERLALLDEVTQAADERLALVDELRQVGAAQLQALQAVTGELKAREAELDMLRRTDS